MGVLCMAGMFLLRLPYAAMIGCLIGFTALIPVAGAYIGAVVGATYPEMGKVLRDIMPKAYILVPG